MKKRRTGLLFGGLFLVILLGGGLFWQMAVRLSQPKQPELPEFGQEKESNLVYTQADFRQESRGLQSLMVYQGGIVARTDSGVLVDGETWEELDRIPAQWGENNRMVCQVSFDSQGRLFGAVYDRQTGQMEIRQKEGEPISLAQYRGQEDEYGNFAVQLRADDTRFYLLSLWEDGYYGLQIFNRQGELEVEFPAIQSFDIDGEGNLYLLHRSDRNTQISKYSLADGEQVYRFTADQTNGFPEQLRLALEQGWICLATSAEVTAYQPQNGVYVDTLMDISKNAPLLDEYFSDFQIDQQNNLYFLLNDQGETARFYRFTPTEDNRADQPYTLTITAPYRDEFMVKAIAQFELEHPDQRVNYDYAYQNYNEFARSDQNLYRDQLTLRLLSGDVGDIVATGSRFADLYQYAQSGLFVDLAPLLGKEKIYPQLDQKLLNGLTMDGKLYGLPLAGCYCYAEINLDLCEKLNIQLDWSQATWSDVLALVPQLEGTDYTLFVTYGKDLERMLSRICISNMPDLIDRKNKTIDLNQPWFVELMEQLRRAAQSPHFIRFGADKMGLTQDALICMDWRTEELMEDSLYWSNLDFQQQTGMKLARVPLFRGEEHSNYTNFCDDLYLISARSKNQEASWELLRRAAEEDLQSQGSVLRNRPLNLQARQKRARQTEEELFQDPEMKDCNRQTAAEMEQIYAATDYCYDMFLLKEDLWRALLPAVEGKIPLTQAIEKAEEQLRLRMYE